MHAVSNASVLYFCSLSDVKPAARCSVATGVVMLKTSKSDGRRKLGHGAEMNSILFDLAMPRAEAYMNMWFPSLERGGLP